MSVSYFETIPFKGTSVTIPSGLHNHDAVMVVATGQNAPDMALPSPFTDQANNLDSGTNVCDLSASFVVNGQQGNSYTITGTGLSNVEGVLVVYRSASASGAQMTAFNPAGQYGSSGQQFVNQFSGDQELGTTLSSPNIYTFVHIGYGMDSDGPSWNDGADEFRYSSVGDPISFSNTAFLVTDYAPLVGTGASSGQINGPTGHDRTQDWNQFTFLFWDQTVELPIVNLVNPNTGPLTGGTAVTITGKGFTGATGVTFGGVAATNVVVVSDTTITCTSPHGPQGGVFDVVVTTPAGSSFLITLDQYTYFSVPGHFFATLNDGAGASDSIGRTPPIVHLPSFRGNLLIVAFRSSVAAAKWTARLVVPPQGRAGT